MEAVAKSKNQRISPRKARVIIDAIRGKNVAEALSSLKLIHKSGTVIAEKLIHSAIDNARVKNEDVDIDALFIKTAFVDKASDRYWRRWRPRAMGRATPITKGMSHITIIVSDGEN